MGGLGAYLQEEGQGAFCHEGDRGVVLVVDGSVVTQVEVLEVDRGTRHGVGGREGVHEIAALQGACHEVDQGACPEGGLGAYSEGDLGVDRGGCLGADQGV